MEMFITPVIGIVCFAIIVVSWFGGVRYFKRHAGGLVAIARGSADRLGLDRAGPRSAG
jgi:AGZA family xanthine/uracil permease-like MFS transporter